MRRVLVCEPLWEATVDFFSPPLNAAVFPART
ncbi:hypothetical protein HNQ79_005246 [Streptomyces candidus]|uniref:Uncharacterized protein n=1 Tax=Streptomyces candidus TaxID=67283 RepID=A0A7X0LSR1_9ACTN|nr:hypothetical protein [Streptomyces candidus]